MLCRRPRTGGSGSAGLLKFDIVPERTRGAGPMRIHINDLRSKGAISVDAFRQPHWYDVEAELDDQGIAVARVKGRIFSGMKGALVLPVIGEITLVPQRVEHADLWRYTDVTLGGRPFVPGTRAVVCRGEWQSFPLDSKRSLRIRVAPEPEMKEGECS